MSTKQPVGRPSIAFAIVFALMAAAPTVGDIGMCSAPPEPLDAQRFFDLRLQTECARCRDCSLGTPACVRACDPKTPRPGTFPDGCHPLAHDGEVCIRAIDALSCGDFGNVVHDPPVVPTECDFCPASDADGGTKP